MWTIHSLESIREQRVTESGASIISKEAAVQRLHNVVLINPHGIPSAALVKACNSSDAKAPL